MYVKYIYTVRSHGGAGPDAQRPGPSQPPVPQPITEEGEERGHVGNRDAAGVPVDQHSPGIRPTSSLLNWSKATKTSGNQPSHQKGEETTTGLRTTSACWMPALKWRAPSQ